VKNDRDLSSLLLIRYAGRDMHAQTYDELLTIFCIHSFTVLSRVCADTQLISPIVHPSMKQMISQQQQQQQQQHSRSSTSDDDSGCALEEYAWCPPGLKAEQVCMIDKDLYLFINISLRFGNFLNVFQKIKCHFSIQLVKNIEL
jgi:hypothetical protein